MERMRKIGILKILGSSAGAEHNLWMLNAPCYTSIFYFILPNPLFHFHPGPITILLTHLMWFNGKKTYFLTLSHLPNLSLHSPKPQTLHCNLFPIFSASSLCASTNMYVFFTIFTIYQCMQIWYCLVCFVQPLNSSFFFLSPFLVCSW